MSTHKAETVSSSSAPEMHRAEAAAMATTAEVLELVRQIEALQISVGYKNALLEQGAEKIDELRRERDNAVIEIKRGDVQYSDEYGRRIQAEQAHIRCIRERDQFKARVAELEQDLSIVRGDLASVTLERDKAKEFISRKGWSVFQFSSSGEFERIARAERKAAKANTELEACRKHAMALAYVVEGHDTVSDTCMCDMCSEARAALEYLKVGKAKG